MEPFQEKISTIRQVATNTGSIAPGNPESPFIPVDGLEQQQNNKPRATTTAALWMEVGPRRMGICHDKPATSPEAILQLVQCGCSKERCPTNRCQCRKAGLNCTDLCNCSDNADNDIQGEDVLYSDKEDSSDSEMYIHD